MRAIIKTIKGKPRVVVTVGFYANTYFAGEDKKYEAQFNSIVNGIYDTVRDFYPSINIEVKFVSSKLKESSK